MSSLFLQVVVVQRNVAASGGYYFSTQADIIIAQRMTITGSIGVISAKFASRNMWNKLGFTFDKIASNEKNSTFYGSIDKFSEEDKKLGMFHIEFKLMSGSQLMKEWIVFIIVLRK